jgi:hypothetical protein
VVALSFQIGLYFGWGLSCPSPKCPVPEMSRQIWDGIPIAILYGKWVCCPRGPLGFFMLIDCTRCHARVDAEVKALTQFHDEEEWPESYQIGLLRCPQCRHILVAMQDLLEPGGFNKLEDPDKWSDAVRLWPEPFSVIALSIPETIRTCLLEARKCLHATAYTACVAMSGRGIEAMCRHFGTKSPHLFEGLKELHEKTIIDKRLYEWGDELRKHRNLAAHASGANFNQVDARDLYDFATAICEYVFVLTARFEAFKKRQLAVEQQA